MSANRSHVDCVLDALLVQWTQESYGETACVRMNVLNHVLTRCNNININNNHTMMEKFMISADIFYPHITSQCVRVYMCNVHVLKWNYAAAADTSYISKLATAQILSSNRFLSFQSKNQNQFYFNTKCTHLLLSLLLYTHANAYYERKYRLSFAMHSSWDITIARANGIFNSIEMGIDMICKMFIHMQNVYKSSEEWRDERERERDLRWDSWSSERVKKFTNLLSEIAVVQVFDRAVCNRLHDSWAYVCAWFVCFYSVFYLLLCMLHACSNSLGCVL